MGKRTKRYVNIGLNEDDKNRISLLAEISGLNLTEYVRKSALGKVVTADADLQIIKELRRLGNMVQQIEQENSGIYVEQTSRALESISTFMEEIAHDWQKKREPDQVF